MQNGRNRFASGKCTALRFALAWVFVCTLLFPAQGAERLLIDFDQVALTEDGAIPDWYGKEFATGLVLTGEPSAVSEGRLGLYGYLEANPGGNRRGMIQWMLPEDMRDWTQIKGLLVDFYNPNDKDLRMGFAIQTGESWTWQEIAPVRLAPGWTKDIYYPFDQPVWKSASTGWSYVLPPFDLEDVRGINFLVVAFEDGSYEFALDNIRVVE